MKSDPVDQDSEFFELDLSDTQDNKRKAVRYVRPDITAILLRKGLFRNRETETELLDVSSKGALIACGDKFSIKSKLTLILIFADGRKFTLDAQVIHCETLEKRQYGLKFNKTSDELGEYLLSSQNDLVFK